MKFGHPRIMRFDLRILLMSVLLASAILVIGHSSVVSAEPVGPGLRISEIYPNAPGNPETGAEFVELFNDSSAEVKLSKYSLKVKNTTKVLPLSGALLAGEYISFNSTSNFILVNDGATIQLVQGLDNAQEQIVEEISYGSRASETQSWSYFPEGWELTPITKAAPNERFEILEPEEPEEPEEAVVDVCLATTEIESSIPVGYMINDSGNCVLVPPVVFPCQVEISEISSQPNYGGKEYIEFYNSSSKPAALESCSLSINGGAEKTGEAIELAAGARYAMEFSSGAIRNSAGIIKLIHSNGAEFRYSYQQTSSGESINFEPGSQLGTVTNRPTPNEQNKAFESTQVTQSPSKAGTASAESCPAGKYRNPETNRCRNITTVSSSLVPCAADQVRSSQTNRCKKASSSSGKLAPCQPGQIRSPETNRCRKSSAASASLAACKPGQVRNPETNRCKKSSSTSSSLKPCAANQERNAETNRCRKISTDVSGTVLGAAAEPASAINKSYKLPAAVLSVTALFGYALYEYRSDISRRLSAFSQKSRPLRPPD